MGQSYTLVNVDRTEVLDRDLFRRGKLMTFSYFDNDRALVLTALLADKAARSVLNARSVVGNASWCGDQLVHAGDYGDNRTWLTDEQITAVDLFNRKDQEWWAKYGLDEEGLPNVNLNDAANALNFNGVASGLKKRMHIDEFGHRELAEEFVRPLIEAKKRLFAINHTTREFLDFGAYWKDHRGMELVIDPLMLLVANGNQRGGGDYYGVNEERVGSWAGDRLSVSTAPPEGYAPLVIRFCESSDPMPAHWIRVKIPAHLDFRA